MLNKIDKLNEASKKSLTQEFPGAILASTRKKEDMQNLRDKILSFFEKDMVEEEIFARYDMPGVVGEVRSNMRVIKESFEDLGVRFTVKARPSDLEKIQKKFGLK